MSDTVVVVAIVVPAMLMATLGIVGLVVGRYLRMSAAAGLKGAEFKAETRSKKKRS